MKIQKIYIAGKVTGLPIADVTMKFGTAQKQIEALGYEVVNPLEVVNDWHMPWQQAMKLCINALLECDGVYCLPDWSISKGAKVEAFMAVSLSIPVTEHISHIKLMMV